jgi:hypothetical protein
MRKTPASTQTISNHQYIINCPWFFWCQRQPPRGRTLQKIGVTNVGLSEYLRCHPFDLPRLSPKLNILCRSIKKHQTILWSLIQISFICLKLIEFGGSKQSIFHLTSQGFGEEGPWGKARRVALAKREVALTKSENQPSIIPNGMFTHPLPYIINSCMFLYCWGVMFQKWKISLFYVSDCKKRKVAFLRFFLLHCNTNTFIYAFSKSKKVNFFFLSLLVRYECQIAKELRCHVNCYS